MIQVELKQSLVTKQISLTISHRKYIDLALNYQHNKRSCSTCCRYLWMLLVKLVIQIEESFVH